MSKQNKEQDHYAELNVEPSENREKIRKNYTKLILKHHPDKNDNSQDSSEKFRRIQEAYEILRDDKSRQEYDLRRQAARNIHKASSSSDYNGRDNSSQARSNSATRKGKASSSGSTFNPQSSSKTQFTPGFASAFRQGSKKTGLNAERQGASQTPGSTSNPRTSGGTRFTSQFSSGVGPTPTRTGFNLGPQGGDEQMAKRNSSYNFTRRPSPVPETQKTAETGNYEKQRKESNGGTQASATSTPSHDHVFTNLSNEKSHGSHASTGNKYRKPTVSTESDEEGVAVPNTNGDESQHPDSNSNKPADQSWQHSDIGNTGEVPPVQETEIDHSFDNLPVGFPQPPSRPALISLPKDHDRSILRGQSLESYLKNMECYITEWSNFQTEILNQLAASDLSEHVTAHKYWSLELQKNQQYVLHLGETREWICANEGIIE